MRHCGICQQTRQMLRNGQASSVNGLYSRLDHAIGRCEGGALMPTGPGDVLDLIRHGHATTRGEILDLTGLSRMTVAQRIDTLLADGLIVEGPAGLATGGRRSKSLQFNAEHSRVLAATVDTTHTRVAVTDLAGRVLVDDHVDVAVESGPQRTLDAITSTALALLEQGRGGPGGRVWARASACRDRSTPSPGGRASRRSCPAGTPTRSPTTCRPRWRRRSRCWPPTTPTRRRSASTPPGIPTRGPCAW